MTLRPKKPCTKVGCTNLTSDGTSRCEHHKVVERTRTRNNDYTSMYNYQWKKIRARFLKENPLCVYCMREGRVEPANVVDHIKPHKGDKELFFDYDNYQSLCYSCHNRKTAKEDGGYGRTISRKDTKE